MIYGERIRIRAVERADLPTFVKWINDPEVQRGIGIIRPYSQVEEEGWFEQMLARPPEEHVLAIEARLPMERADLLGEREDLPGEAILPGKNEGNATSQEYQATAGTSQERWQLIGSIGFGKIDWLNRNAELGIDIGEKSYWNKGYGTEAVRLLVQYGFHTLNLHRIFLRVLETNPRAIRAYEKAGFTHELRQRQAEFREGKYIDMLMMSILRHEF